MDTSILMKAQVNFSINKNILIYVYLSSKRALFYITKHLFKILKMIFLS